MESMDSALSRAYGKGVKNFRRVCARISFDAVIVVVDIS